MRRINPIASIIGFTLICAARSAVAQTAPPEPPPVWDTSLSASFVSTSGNTDTTTLGSDYSLHRRWPVWQIETTASAVRTSDTGVTTAERYVGAFRADRKLTSVVALSSGERAEHDRFSGLELRSVLDGGVVWKVVHQSHWTLESTTSLAWNHDDPTTGPTTDHPIGLLQALSKIPLGSAGDTTARFTFYPDFADSANYRSEAEATLQASMNSHLALKFGYLWRYSHVPIEGFKRADNTTTASLVLRWKSAATIK
jgi:putative salt-induced outer membrane protein YdiY